MFNIQLKVVRLGNCRLAHSNLASLGTRTHYFCDSSTFKIYLLCRLSRLTFDLYRFNKDIIL